MAALNSTTSPKETPEEESPAHPQATPPEGKPPVRQLRPSVAAALTGRRRTCLYFAVPAAHGLHAVMFPGSDGSTAAKRKCVVAPEASPVSV